jgi:Zn-dependent protease with chaperone function
MGVPFYRIETQEVLDEMSKRISQKILNFDQARTDFVVAHEFSHYLQKDSLKKLFWEVMNMASVIALYVGLFLTPGMVTLLRTSAAWGIALVVSTISRTFFFAFSRYLEKRADLQGIELVKTNIGALQWFQEVKEIIDAQSIDESINPSHPTLQERLVYAQSWRPAERSAVAEGI